MSDSESEFNSDNTMEAIRESLLTGDTDVARRVFISHGARAPEIIWAPKDAEIRNPLLRQFAEICRASSAANGKFLAADFRMNAFETLGDWLMLIDIDKDAGGYRYLHYGTAIAESYGQDMTSRLTSDLGGHIADFFCGLYAAVEIKKEHVFSEHEPPLGIFVRTWQRLIVPLFDGNGVVTQFAVLNIPDNELRVGLELMVDPVFVLTEDKTILYANRAAHSLFSLDTPLDRTQTLAKLTGISLGVSMSAADMLSRRVVEDSVQLALCGAIAERLVMTVSAAQHRGHAFYVAVMRMIGT